MTTAPLFRAARSALTVLRPIRGAIAAVQKAWEKLPRALIQLAIGVCKALVWAKLAPRANVPTPVLALSFRGRALRGRVCTREALRPLSCASVPPGCQTSQSCSA
jgi:hypothetical protein